MNMRRPWAWLCLIATVAACVLMPPQRARAVGPCTLTVHFEHEGTTVPDVASRIYLVATKDSSDDYVLAGAFGGSGIDLATLQKSDKASDWDSAAKQLASYVGDEGIAPAKSGASNASGDVTFSELAEGLYLVISDPAKIGDTTYDFASYLIALPGMDDAGSPVTSVTSSPKSSVHTDTPTPPKPTPPKPTPPKPSKPGKLVPTGETLLPIALFAVCGLVLVALGWKLHRGKNRS